MRWGKPHLARIGCANSRKRRFCSEDYSPFHAFHAFWFLGTVRQLVTAGVNVNYSQSGQALLTLFRFSLFDFSVISRGLTLSMISCWHWQFALFTLFRFSPAAFPMLFTVLFVAGQCYSRCKRQLLPRIKASSSAFLSFLISWWHRRFTAAQV